MKSLTSLMRHLEASEFTSGTTPMMPCGGNAPLHCRCFVYGYSLDGFDFPCYFLWPHRTQQGNFWLLVSQTRRHFDMSLATFLKPLALQQLYDAFGLKAELGIRTAALEVFHLQESQEGDLSNLMRLLLEDGLTIRSNQLIRTHQKLISAMYRLILSVSTLVKLTASRQVVRKALMETEMIFPRAPAKALAVSRLASQLSDQHAMLVHVYEATQNVFHKLLKKGS